MSNIAATLLIPFLGTALGSGMVFLLKKDFSVNVEKALLGFAAGVMIAASVWSLMIPSIDMAEEQGMVPWIPPLIGFMLGIGFLLGMDKLIPHLHLDSDTPEGLPLRIPRTGMMLLAVTLHNIPEGMAVGVTCAGALASGSGISVSSAMVLSLGIAIQNFPEGAIVSMPLLGEGMSKRRAFFFGTLSGAVEPVSGLLMLVFVEHMLPFLPYLLAFAAGAMLYVVIEELIPESQAGEHNDIATIGAALGFALMMVLDVALG